MPVLNTAPALGARSPFAQTGSLHPRYLYEYSAKIIHQCLIRALARGNNGILIFSTHPEALAQRERSMSSRINMRVAAAGALAITLVVLPAFGSTARDRSTATTEFSAQQNNQKDQKNQQKQQGQQQKIQQKQQGQQQQKFQQKQQGQQQQKFQQKQQGQQQKFQQKQQGQQQKFQGQQQKQQTQQLKSQNKNVKVFTPKGPNAKVVTDIKIRNIPRSGPGRFAIRGHNYSAWRSGYRVRHGDGWRTFVALSALGVLAIGAAEYYPYAYIDSPQPFCEGLTEDGCQLDWQDVETIEGDVIGQCVAFCPWQ
jgi:hypothetical protein